MKKEILKKILKKTCFVFIFYFFALTQITTTIYAQQPSICTTGFCMVENQTCPGGSIQSDSACTDSPYNGTACCIPEDEDPEPSPSSVPINVDGPNNETFDALNPLITDGDADLASQLSSPGGIVSRFLRFLFPLAGLALFAMLVWGGFEILAKSAQSQKALDAGKNRITAAIVGFLLLFATYWMAQIIEAVFGIVIV